MSAERTLEERVASLEAQVRYLQNPSGYLCPVCHGLTQILQRDRYGNLDQRFCPACRGKGRIFTVEAP